MGLSSDPGETLLMTDGFCPFAVSGVTKANIIVVEISPPEPVLADDAFDIDGSSVTCTGGCAGDAMCVAGVCYVPKGRFVSVRPNPANAGLLTARRVSLDVGAGPASKLGWVQEPRLADPAGPGPVPVLVSPIGPMPVFRDWSEDPIDSQGRRVIHISGCEVSNKQTYIIQSIGANADPGDEASYSAPLSLPTTARFGDVAGAPGMPPDGSPGISDVFLIVLGFQGDQIQPKTWLKIAPSMEAADPTTIAIASDVLSAVLGFQGVEYTGLAPLDCP